MNANRIAKAIATAMLLLAAGCSSDSPPLLSIPDAVPPALGAGFEPESSGSVTGQVFWRGQLPECPPFEAHGPGPDGKWRTTLVPNPNMPAINARTKAIEGAVVYLNQVPPERSRPWDHPAVRIIADKNAIQVEQGEGSPYAVGFVRRGDEIELDSRLDKFESICARGGEFFSLPFPQQNQPLRRILREPGIVEFTSGAGRFWVRAYAFVTEHPYFGRTDAAGKFVLPQVPPGEYRLMCWLPNPEVATRDRDPNLGQVIRHHHAPPLERFQAIEVLPRQTVSIDMHIGK